MPGLNFFCHFAVHFRAVKKKKRFFQRRKKTGSLFEWPIPNDRPLNLNMIHFSFSWTWGQLGFVSKRFFFCFSGLPSGKGKMPLGCGPWARHPGAANKAMKAKKATALILIPAHVAARQDMVQGVKVKKSRHFTVLKEAGLAGVRLKECPVTFALRFRHQNGSMSVSFTAHVFFHTLILNRLRNAVVARSAVQPTLTRRAPKDSEISRKERANDGLNGLTLGPAGGRARIKGRIGRTRPADPTTRGAPISGGPAGRPNKERPGLDLRYFGAPNDRWFSPLKSDPVSRHKRHKKCEVRTG